VADVDLANDTNAYDESIAQLILERLLTVVTLFPWLRVNASRLHHPLVTLAISQSPPKKMTRIRDHRLADNNPNA